MLKLLRTILLQDAALLLYTPFYRQMLRHSSVFGSPIFLSETFRDKSDINGEALMTSDCKPMYGSMPHDTRLGKVRPALTGGATQQLASPRPGGSVNSPRLPRQGQLSGLAEAFPDPQNSVADEPASAKPSEKASSCRLSRLRQLKEQLEEDSPGLTDSAADKLATESDEASALRRMTRLRQLKEMLDDTQDTKRRRVEKASTPPARLEHAPARVPRMAFSQRSPDSGVRRISMPSPSASIYLVEDEDGNFVDKPREPQAILPGDGDPVGPMDWEALSFDFINDGALSNRTPESISDGAVPELDFAAAVPALPKAAPLLESDSDNMVSDVEALPASSDSLSAEPAVALAQVLGKVCQAQKLLLKPGLRIRKSMLKLHVFVKRIVALRAKTARSLVSGGVVDSNAVERMRELGMLLQRTKNILAKLEEMVGSNGDLLGELMSSGVEEALGNAAVLLSHPLSDSASH
ncbi:hypothetical protein GGI00_002386 [Coemansia sp. RSA 2681]|nr:hypothetical protein GGI00_002386 [Coemansia sp. RSA 2681]